MNMQTPGCWLQAGLIWVAVKSAVSNGPGQKKKRFRLFSAVLNVPLKQLIHFIRMFSEPFPDFLFLPGL